MKFSTAAVRILGLGLLISLIFARQADAYLDPGTGSYFLQILLAALLGAFYALKMFWQRIVTFFRGLFTPKRKTDR